MAVCFRFPNDDVLKQQWMALVERSSVTKNAKLCSHHFDKSAYADSDGYTSKRYLLKTAVPCKSVGVDKFKVTNS